MSVNLKVTLGTVNYTDWLHVTASKVSAPTVTVWEDWINVPVTNYNFVIPGLDPENYYVRYYDAATDSALGTLVMELLVNALTSDVISERRFYTCDGPGTYDPADGDASIIDPYLINKIVTGCFKEGFRYFKETDEYTFDDTTGTIIIINGTSFSTDEKFIVEIKYNVAATSSVPPGGLYTDTMTITAATQTLVIGDINKRVRLLGTIATQVITLPALSILAVENGFYFDNTVGGTAVQVKIVVPGADRIKFNGFMAASDLFAEFWVSKGEHLLIRKIDSSYWEVITDYKGVECGNRQSAGYVGMPGWMPEDGALSDGDEYPRVWWWLNNILPSTHVITDDLVIGTYTHPSSKPGQFVKHSSLKKFRWPNTQGISEKGLADFDSYGSDVANRPVDYPGGYQDEMLLRHGHDINTTNSATSGNDVGDPIRGTITGTPNTRNREQTSSIAPKTITWEGGEENRIKNTGVIYMRKI